MVKKEHSKIVKKHFDFKYRNYDSLIRNLIPKYEEMHKLVVNSIDFPKGKEIDILDLGLGTGQTALELLRKFPNCRIDGVDISERMIKEGEKRLKDYLDRVNFICQDVKDFKPRKKYDACVAVLSVHHLDSKQKQQLFKNVFNSLKKGGIFVIGDIIKFDTQKETRRKEKKWKYFLIKNLGQKEGSYWFKNYQEEDLPDSISNQVKWLKLASFIKVKTLWKHMNYAVLFTKTRF